MKRKLALLILCLFFINNIAFASPWEVWNFVTCQPDATYGINPLINTLNIDSLMSFPGCQHLTHCHDVLLGEFL